MYFGGQSASNTYTCICTVLTSTDTATGDTFTNSTAHLCRITIFNLFLYPLLHVSNTSYIPALPPSLG